MIRSVDELDPAVAAAVTEWLSTATAGLTEDVRSNVTEDLRRDLFDRLEPDTDLGHAATAFGELGPVVDLLGEPHPAGFPKLLRGLRPSGIGERIATTWWNPADNRILAPRAVGLGWDLNFGALAVRAGLIEPDAEAIPFSATPRAAFGQAALLPVGLAAAVVAHYLIRGRSLPTQLPDHWDVWGTPDRWTSRRRAAITDIAVTGATAAAAAWAATDQASPGPRRAGIQAMAASLATVAAVVTVARSLKPGRRVWLGPGMALLSGASAAATLGWLARAGRAAEIAGDLRSTAKDPETDD